MVRKFAFAILLTTVAGVASASVSPPGVICTTHWFLGFIPYEVCANNSNNSSPTPVKAPEIDAASAAAGLTLTIGALAVLRGRRSKIAVAKA
jgi:hypothetical protein